MPTYRILIVDDQREMRNALRSAVETLGRDYKVVAVPSAEEALLEIRLQKFDVLVADVLLPGMSGLELMEKAKARNIESKIILITGTVDRKIRREVADAGADAFFLKPLNTADFLDAIERCLGLVDASYFEQDLLSDLKPTENVSERLTSLRKELNAITAVLLDDRGKILASAGDLPDASLESGLLPTLMASFSASGKVARYLGSNPPNDISYFSGVNYDLFLAHVGESYALFMVMQPITVEEEISTILREVYAGVKDLYDILHNMGVHLKSESPPPQAVVEPEEEMIEEDEEEAPILDALFKAAVSKVPKAEEVDAFWDSLIEGKPVDEVQSADALTYDQAVQLGLAPDEEGEE
jgi:CheY-like chemotaxis protein